MGAASPGTLLELKKLLYEDLVCGYAVGESSFEQGISAVAAPVRAADGEFVAAVSLTVNKPTLEPSTLRERLIRQVLAAADEISAGLGDRSFGPTGQGEEIQDVLLAAVPSGAGCARDSSTIEST